MWAFLFSVHIPLDSVKVRKPLFHQISQKTEVNIAKFKIIFITLRSKFKIII